MKTDILKKLKRKETLQGIGILILCLFSLYSVYLVVRTAAYSTFLIDDFKNRSSFRNFEWHGISSYFSYLIRSFRRGFFTQQGAYFPRFITLFRVKELTSRGALALSIDMMINAGLFYLTFILLLYTFMKKRIGSFSYSVIFISVIIFALTAFQVYDEIYYWMAAAGIYSYPLSCVLISLILILQYRQRPHVWQLIAAGIFGFLGMGGVLMIPAAGCSIMLLILIYDLLKERKTDKGSLIMFFVYLAGALLNVAAPGNYKRQARVTGLPNILEPELIATETADGGEAAAASSGSSPGILSRLFGAVKTTVLQYEARIVYYLGETCLILLLILLLIVGIALFRKGIRIERAYLIVSICALFVPFIVTFPVSFGYGSMEFPSRCQFVFDLCFYLTTFNLAVQAGIFIGSRIENREILFSLITLLSVICVVLISVDGFSIYDIKTRQMREDLRNHIYQDHHDACFAVYDYMDAHTGEDVVIEAEDFPEPIRNFRNFWMSAYNYDHYINTNVAKYYGLKSVIVHIPEEEQE
ncbi:MAG: DUF6056 family protein [Lachnospiraceae bacterium]|nr:DUF6056 family protein [Lachnospiraceae bacterium]